MAYSATVTVEKIQRGPRRAWIVRCTETDAAATSEWTIPNSAQLPEFGTITLYKADLTAGTGTTIQPKVGRATGPTAATMDWVGQISAAAAYINDATPLRYSGLGDGRVLYIRSTVDAGADNAISTEITIVEGHF